MVDLRCIEAGAFILRKREQDGVFVYADVNPALERITGFARDRFVGRTSVEVFGLEAGKKLQAHQQTCAQQRIPVEYEPPVSIPFGEHFHHMILMPVLTKAGDVVEIIAFANDVRERKRLENELKAANLRLNLALEALGGANWSYDTATARFELGPSFDRILGTAVPRSMSLDDWLGYVVDEDRTDTCFADLLTGKIEQGTAEFRVKAGNGETRWLRCRRRAVSDGSRLTAIMGVVIDISSEKRQQAELSLQASSDALTGLANRRRFDKELAIVRTDPALAVLMIDVDHFKAYNDRYGHIAGDAVLKTVASLLARIASSVGGIAARYGGEEFAILVPGLFLDDAKTAADRLIGELDVSALPHDGSTKGKISVSVGVAAGLCSEPGDATDLVVAADRALYVAKAAGRGCYRIGESDKPADTPEPDSPHPLTSLRHWPTSDHHPRALATASGVAA